MGPGVAPKRCVYDTRQYSSSYFGYCGALVCTYSHIAQGQIAQVAHTPRHYSSQLSRLTVTGLRSVGGLSYICTARKRRGWMAALLPKSAGQARRRKETQRRSTLCFLAKKSHPLNFGASLLKAAEKMMFF